MTVGVLDAEVPSEVGAAVTDPDIRARIDAMSRALAKLPPFRGTVYRGGHLDDAALGHLLPGRLLTEKGFTSTTSDPRRSLGGSVRFVIASSAGKDVAAFSQLPEQAEVVFDRDADFVVLHRAPDPDTGLVEVYLADVPETESEPPGRDVLEGLLREVAAAKAAGQWATEEETAQPDKFDGGVGVDNDGRVTSYASLAEARLARGLLPPGVTLG